MSTLCEELHGKAKAELIGLNYDLLDAIVDLDYETFDELCADDISCLEPETNQSVVIGKEFHKYYFDVFGGDKKGVDAQKAKNENMERLRVATRRPSMLVRESSLSSGMNAGTNATTRTNVTMVQPHVQFLGDEDDPTGAVISYVKLTQQTAPGKPPVTMQQSESRVWEKRDGHWVNIHFHKSPYKA